MKDWGSNTNALPSPSYLTDHDSEFVRAVQENAEAIFGRSVPATEIRGGSDAWFFARAGAKTLNFGPSDADCNPHTADKKISLEQVRDTGATVAASIVDAV